MTNRYLIHCCSGSGGLFLTSVFAKMLQIPVQPVISDTGHCHNQGHGDWKSVPGVAVIGNHWAGNYHPGNRLYYVHELDSKFKQHNPDVKIVRITVQPSDYRLVTELYVSKAWPALWTPEEYARWASADYPPYSANNIEESQLIRQDLINNLSQTLTADWVQRCHNDPWDHSIDFRTVMGLDDQLLDQVVADITAQQTTDEIRAFVAEYQTVNKELYFNAGRS